MAFVTKFGNLFKDLISNVQEVEKILEDDPNWQFFESGALSMQNAIEAQDLSGKNKEVEEDPEPDNEDDQYF